MGKRKNGNGEGTIYQRKDGTYCAQKVVDGRRVTGYGKNKTEAREKLAKNIKKAILNGNILPPKDMNMKLKEYTPYFIKSLKNISQTTIKGYEECTYLIDKFVGDTKLKDVGKDTILCLGLSMKEEDYSAKTTLVVCRFLHRIAKKLKADGYTAKDISFSSRDLRLNNKKSYNLPPIEDVVKGINNLRKAPMRYMAMFCLYTGLRRGELLGLMWDDINWDAGTLQVNRSVSSVDKNGEIVFSPPKNKNIGQVVHIPDKAIQILKDVKNRHKELGVDSPYVFCDDKGKIFRPRAITYTFRYAFRDICPHGSVHMLRHLNATIMAKNNIPLRTISMQLRHSSIDTTAIYINSIMGEELKEIKSLSI